MKILDKYLVRRFLLILAFSLFAFMMIFVVVNLIERLDSFMKHGVPKWIVVQLYFYQMPYILTLTLPVAMLLSSLFSVGNLARQNEITAMKASGLSLYRILAPLFILGILISAGAFVFSEQVQPRASERYALLKDQYIDRLQNRWRKLIRNPFMRDDQGRLFSMRDFNAATNTGSTVSIRHFQNQELLSRIDAKEITWEDETWVLHNGYQRSFQDSAETAIPFTRLTIDSTSLRPEDFSRFLNHPEEMSSAQLREFILEVRRNGGNANRWLVDLYLKYAIPFANLIIVLFGASLAAQKRRGSATTGFGLSLAVVFIYFGMVKTSQAMGQSGVLQPLLAAWLANLVFGVAGVFVLIRASK
ncbi:LptF/LptG family permease [candidate division KSB1 bacterium]|nr:LptF/LptG family permease [candidate division KSB1 bacterium]